MDINETAQAAYDNTIAHGFRDNTNPNDLRQTATELMLITSELAEALEIVRDNHPLSEIYYGTNGKPEGFGIELADAVIRIMDTAVARGIDLAAAIEAKMEYNESRPYKHGRSF